jgi:phosphatidylglycerophosphate synthase
MGCLAEILAVVALLVLWRHPIPHLWWWVLGVLVAQSVIARVVKESLTLYGMHDKATIFWGIVCTILQISLIALAIVSFLMKHPV